MSPRAAESRLEWPMVPVVPEHFRGLRGGLDFAAEVRRGAFATGFLVMEPHGFLAEAGEGPMIGTAKVADQHAARDPEGIPVVTSEGDACPRSSCHSWPPG